MSGMDGYRTALIVGAGGGLSASLARLFAGELADRYPPVLSPAGLAGLLGRSPKTIYHWIALGHFDGAFRKRGKHVLLLRDRALCLPFNGKDWT